MSQVGCARLSVLRTAHTPMTFPATVWFEETGEQRLVCRSCLVCRVDADDPWYIVSPSGHHGAG